jgi:1-acyl-sn-glycerol-3-phosphate acyltransferase
MNRTAVQCIEIGLTLLFGISKNRARLPDEQSLLVANHDSFLDAYALASLLSWRHKGRTRVAAAKDAFATGPLGWFARTTLDVVLVERRPAGQDPLAEIKELLRRGSSLILFPEGTRGEPGQMTRFKRGVGLLAVEFPDLPVYPVFMRGVERILGRNDSLLVPFEIGLTVAEAPLFGRDSQRAFPESPRDASRHFAAAAENAVRRLGGLPEVPVMEEREGRATSSPWGEA